MNNCDKNINSIYCYPNSDVLKNKLGLKNKSDLMKYEARITAAKLFGIRQQGITGKFDVKHITQIHKYLFEDVYPFAGKFRNENISKGNFKFAMFEYIEPEIEKLLNELQKENYLQGMDKEKIANRLAYYMSELNVLHPFREGNGRTIREFIRQLALKNGYVFNLKEVKPKEVLEASKESVIDTKYLEDVIYKCLTKI